MTLIVIPRFAITIVIPVVIPITVAIAVVIGRDDAAGRYEKKSENRAVSGDALQRAH
jgi:hypothetical protein